jgi:hypothetical protein
LCATISVNRSINVPSARTSIWLPIVWLCEPGSAIMRAGSQLTPPLVVRENQIGPRKVFELISPWMLARDLLFGETSRSHTA